MSSSIASSAAESLRDVASSFARGAARKGRPNALRLVGLFESLVSPESPVSALPESCDASMTSAQAKRLQIALSSGDVLAIQACRRFIDSLRLCASSELNERINPHEFLQVALAALEKSESGNEDAKAWQRESLRALHELLSPEARCSIVTLGRSLQDVQAILSRRREMLVRFQSTEDGQDFTLELLPVASFVHCFSVRSGTGTWREIPVTEELVGNLLWECCGISPENKEEL